MLYSILAHTTGHGQYLNKKKTNLCCSVSSLRSPPLGHLTASRKEPGQGWTLGAGNSSPARRCLQVGRQGAEEADASEASI